MFYKLLINYFRLKLLRLMFNRLISSNTSKNKKAPMNMLIYGLEFLVTYYFDSKRKTKLPRKLKG